MLPCLTLSIIRYGSRVKWSNPGKGVAPSPTTWYSSYWKGILQITLDYSRQLYIYVVHSISFQILFLQALKIVVDSWKFSMLLRCILWDDFYDSKFKWALLLIVHTWNSSPLWSNLLQLQCTCCTTPTTSGRPHGSPLVWACQWPSSQPLSSPQLSHNDRLWA